MSPTQTKKTTRQGIPVKSLLDLIELCLNQEDWRIRKSAVELILQLDNQEQALKQLTTVINDSHHGVRVAVIQALLETGLRPSNSILITTIGDEAESNRALAVQLLIQLTPDERSGWINKIINGSDRVSKTALLLLLNKLETAEQAEIIDTIETHTTSDLQLRHALLQGIAQASMHSRQCNNIIERLLSENLHDIDLVTLLESCPFMPARQCSSVIQKSLDAEKLSTRFLAAQALGALAKREPVLAKQFYAKLLQDKDLNTYLAESSKLNILPTEAQVGLLKRMTREREESLSWAISHGIGHLPQVIAIPIIKRILREHPDANLRRTTVENLGELSWQASAPLIELALQDKDEGVRLAAVKQTENVPTTHALPLLAVAFQDKRLGVREEAVIALGKNYLEINLPLFYRALHDQEPNVRAKAASFYHLFPGEFISTNLPKTLTDPNRKTVFAASKTIPYLKKPLNQQFINQYKDHESIAIRTGIASSLAALPWLEARNLLGTYLDDNQEQVRIAAINCLAEFGKKNKGNEDGVDQEQFINYMEGALRNGEAGIRLAAIQAASSLPIEEKLPLLLPLFNQNNTYLCLAILESLKDKMPR